MSESESLGTATNALVTRLDLLPEITFYDNGCSISHSISLRFPWITDCTTIPCDRSHYTSHKCSVVFDPDSYPLCDSLKASGAEAINRAWSVSRSHIRFLEGENLIPFLYARAFLINARAHIRDRSKSVDVEDQNLIEHVNRLLPCERSWCKSE